MNYSLKPFNKNIPFKFTLDATLSIQSQQWDLVYVFEGNLDDIDFDWSEHPISRKNLLWNKTCLEGFFLQESGAYLELNFSPAGSWNLFKFSNYRIPIPSSEKTFNFSQKNTKSTNNIEFQYRFHLEERFEYFNPAVVVKNKSGELSYWSHQHSLDKPDFHEVKNFSKIVP